MTQELLIVLSLALLVTGLIITFNLFGRTKKRSEEFIEPINDASEMLDSVVSGGEKRSLSDTVDYYQGKRGFIVTEEIKGAKAILDETGRSAEYHKTVLTSCILEVGGFFVGFFVLDNIVAAIAMMAGLFMVPLWRLKLYRNKYRKYLAAQLESATSLITTSYVRNNDIVAAVQENTEQLPPIVKPYFQSFLAECKVNPSIKNCVRNLRERIDDNIFKEWCETLLHTIDNSEMKEALMPICKKYSSVRIIQDEIDLETTQAIMEYFVMMAIMICVYPMVWVLNKEWFSYYSSIAGKISVGYTLFVLFFSLAKLIGVMQPVQYRR